MKKLVIYTCITGNYDKIADPVAVCPDVDYICFCESRPESNVWQWRPLPSKQTSDALTSRWPKINPDKLFGDYRYSLWMDANVIIKDSSFYDRVSFLMDKGVLYAGICHPFRDDVYEESVTVVANSRETLPKLMRAVKFLISEGFPRRFGLMENNVILRRHNEEKVREFDNLWWSFLEKYTYRDQISQGYCLWKTALEYEYLLEKGQTARNSPSLLYVPHRSVLKTDRSLRGRWNAYKADVNRVIYRLWLKLNLPS